MNKISWRAAGATSRGAAPPRPARVAAARKLTVKKPRPYRGKVARASPAAWPSKAPPITPSPAFRGGCFSAWQRAEQHGVVVGIDDAGERGSALRALEAKAFETAGVDLRRRACMPCQLRVALRTDNGAGAAARGRPFFARFRPQRGIRHDADHHLKSASARCGVSIRELWK
jgi:hypothetical protein